MRFGSGLGVAGHSIFFVSFFLCLWSTEQFRQATPTREGSVCVCVCVCVKTRWGNEENEEVGLGRLYAAYFINTFHMYVRTCAQNVDSVVVKVNSCF